MQRFFDKLVAPLIQLAGNVVTINSQSIRVLNRDANGDVLFCSAASLIPTKGGSGFAVGCEFIKTDGAVGAQIFVNEGSNTSCDFLAIAGADAIEAATISLTNAEIKALRATPKTLVAAPGTGKSLQFLGAKLKLSGGTNALTESADNMAVKLNDGSGLAVSQTIECTGFIDQTAATETNALQALDTIVASASAENKALVLHNTGDGEYGGNAAADVTMKVYVLYRIVTV